MRPLLRVLLWPVSLLYGFAVRLRNHLYNIGYKKSFSFQSTVISVGNLSAGGNGKTPMVEYLIRLLIPNNEIAVLSRGYGRRTSGFRLAEQNDSASGIGDEPLQMFKKFSPRLTVAVGESRALAIPKILFEKPEVEVIILDDAFQHRSVIPQLSILVTDYRAPFFRDFLLPAGRLREPRNGAKRAHVVVVTRCPPHIDKEKRGHFIKEIRKYHPGVPVCFSSIIYKDPVHYTTGVKLDSNPMVMLISGIASPKPLVEYVSNRYKLVGHLRFRDHFRYTKKVIDRIEEQFQELPGDSKILLTTEKDMVRLAEFDHRLKNWPLYYLPIECGFIDGNEKFNKMVLNSLESIEHTKI